jgi:hypothetical protein
VVILIDPIIKEMFIEIYTDTFLSLEPADSLMSIHWHRYYTAMEELYNEVMSGLAVKRCLRTKSIVHQ